MGKFKFYLIADPHYFKNSLGARGKEYEDFMHYEQKCFAETQSINEAVFAHLKDAKEADTVLIAGDLIFNGEKESHLEFIKLLKELQKSGKKVYVVTADHDFRENRKECIAFDETGRLYPENTKRDELFDLYRDFGFGDAIAFDRQHLSYVAQLCPGLRLLALNNDGAKGGGRYFDDEHIKWIKEQTARARADGQMMIAMNHYPLMPGQPVFSVIKSTWQNDGFEVCEMLADEGVHLVFTGHMHNNSINEHISKNGNKIYEVCTGSIIADPSVIRLVEIEDESTVSVNTIPAPDFDWETGSKSCRQYLSDLFDNMIVNVIYDMEHDTDRMMNKFHLDKRLKPVLRIVGKALNRTTVGGLSKLLLIKTDGCIKQEKVKDVAKDFVRVIFEGNQPYLKGTPRGDAIIAVFSRLNPVIKQLNLTGWGGEKPDFLDLIVNSAGNYDIDDYNAVLKW